MGIQLEPFFRYYKGNPEAPHQVEAVRMLEELMPSSLLSVNAAWVKKYRESVPDKVLDVKYFYQTDNGPTGWRQCQTSSIAMCLNFLGVNGIDDDLDYLRVVQKYGDTTLQSSHQQALRELRVDGRFRTDLGKADLISEIEHGCPCAIGILHHGSLANGPRGGGHYITLRGVTDTAALVHDPFGSLDLERGVWLGTGPEDGKDEIYAWNNLLPRFDIGGGWGWVFS